MATPTDPVQGSPLFEMLADLARSPERAEQFRSDPTSIMAEYNLPEGQQEAIKRAVHNKLMGKFMEHIGGEIIRTNISC